MLHEIFGIKQQFHPIVFNLVISHVAFTVFNFLAKFQTLVNFGNFGPIIPKQWRKVKKCIGVRPELLVKYPSWIANK